MMLAIKVMLILLWNLFLFSSKSMHKIMLLMLNLMFLMFLISYSLKVSWFMLMFSILMLGGLMVLFIYFTSLFSKLDLKVNLYEFSFFIFVFLVLFKVMSNWVLLVEKESFKDLDMLNIFMFFNSSFLILFLIIYMFFMLVMGMELVFNVKSSFRLMF